jgi:BirA family biotin operon repressor/biotin-[acetyl-CoA-carboxylase] ligase
MSAGSDMSAGERPERIDAGPSGTRFGEVRSFGELDSTNSYLLAQARAAAPEGLVVVAAHQTAGRGRLGRRWEAPAGANLLVSFLLRPRLAIEELHLCTVALALAARSACERVAGVAPVLKWPNDLLLGEKKLAGILAESVPEASATPGAEGGGQEGERRAVVIGLGLNVGWPGPEGEEGQPAVPDDLGEATSLWRETGVRLEPAQVLGELLGEYEVRLAELESAEGRRRLASDYRRVCDSLGREVMVTLSDETVSGRVLDINVDGQLLVDVGACIRTISAGDVVHLRS